MIKNIFKFWKISKREKIFCNISKAKGESKFCKISSLRYTSKFTKTKFNILHKSNKINSGNKSPSKSLEFLKSSNNLHKSTTIEIEEVIYSLYLFVLSYFFSSIKFDINSKTSEKLSICEEKFCSFEE